MRVGSILTYPTGTGLDLKIGDVVTGIIYFDGPSAIWHLKGNIF